MVSAADAITRQAAWLTGGIAAGLATRALLTTALDDPRATDRARYPLEYIQVMTGITALFCTPLMLYMGRGGNGAASARIFAPLTGGELGAFIGASAGFGLLT